MPSSWRPQRHDRLHSIEPPRARTGSPAWRHSRFFECPDPTSRVGGSPGGRCQPGIDPRTCLFDHPGPQSRRRGRRSLGRSLERRRVARRLAPHDDLACLRRAHANGPATGQDVLLHAAHGRRGGQLRFSQGNTARGHELSDLSPGRVADCGRLFAGRHDESDLLQRTGSAKGPSVAGSLLFEGRWFLLTFRKPCDAIYPGGRLGDGIRDQERYENRCRMDWGRLDCRIRLPRRPGFRVHLQGAGGAQHRQQPMGDFNLPGHRARWLRNFRGARTRIRGACAQG